MGAYFNILYAEVFGGGQKMKNNIIITQKFGMPFTNPKFTVDLGWLQGLISIFHVVKKILSY